MTKAVAHLASFGGTIHGRESSLPPRVARFWAVILLTLGTGAFAGAEEFKVKSRGAHESVWEATEVFKEGDRELIVTNRYIETATGLNYFNEGSGAYEASDPAFEVVNGRIVVRKAQHRAMLGADSLDPEGLVQLWSPDGEWVALQTAGLALTDPVSGKSVWLAELQEVAPEFVDANTIVYPGALVGDGVVADIQVTSRLSGIECDMVVRRAITRELIEEYQMDPALARVEAWHAVVGKSNLESRLGQIERASGMRDENHSLRLGDLEFGQGKAFPATAGNMAHSGGSEVIVGKELIAIEGEEFLIESVPFVEAEKALESLPEAPQARRIDRERLEKAFAGMEQGRRGKPVSLADASRTAGRLEARAGARRTRSDRPAFEEISRGEAGIAEGDFGRGIDKAGLAGASPHLAGYGSPGGSPHRAVYLAGNGSPGGSTHRAGAGYVIDFITVNTSQSNYRWSGTETYLITGTVNLTGTNTFFEGGTVIKFATNSGAKIVVKAPLVWEGDAYRPVVLTGRDDASVGQVISPLGTWNETNRYAEVALEIAMTNNAAIIQNLRIRQAKTAIQLDGKAGHVISHAQLVNCGFGIKSAVNTDFAVRNALFYNVATNFLQSGTSTGRLEHVTVNAATRFNDNVTALAVTNSILAAIGSVGTISSSDSVSSYASASGLFKAVLAGAHYLADGSTNRNSGTGGIDSFLLKDLKARTTYAPVELTSDFTINTTLAPRAVRDADGVLDRGYHYDSLDFVSGPRWVTNATLLLTNGVAIGGFGNYFLNFGGSGNVVSEGKPDHLNRIATYNSVQEQPARWITNHTVFSGHKVNLRFTDVSLMAGISSMRTLFLGTFFNAAIRIQDSSLRGGYWFIWNHVGSTTSPEVYLTNNIVERCTFEWTQGYEYYEPGPLAITFQNNLFTRSTLNLGHYSSTYGAWDIYDNLFDNCSMSCVEHAGDPVTTVDYNGFASTWTPFYSAGSHQKHFLISDFVQGPLGRFYYPINGPTNSLASLRNAGSQNATNAGLFHYTAFADQVKETNSVVDIGFHYVACYEDKEIPKGFMTMAASSTFPGWDANKAKDGNTTDNGWHNYSTTEDPAWLRVEFTTAREIVRLGYIAREVNGNPYDYNGRYKDYAIYVTDSNSGNTNNWGAPVAAGQFGWGSAQERRNVSFPVATGKYLYLRRITASDGSGGAAGFAGANEIWLFEPGDPTPMDSDDDGVPDYLEDQDGNGVVSTGESTPWHWDSDGDGFRDGVELSLGLNPTMDQAGNSANYRTYGYDRINRLESVTGGASLEIEMDEEGNLMGTYP